MKKLITLATFAAFASPLWAATQTVTLSVPGMNCATCPITVKKALTKLGGVVDVKSNLGKRRTSVVYDDTQVSLDALTRATKDAGFPSTVTGVEP